MCYIFLVKEIVILAKKKGRIVFEGLSNVIILIGYVKYKGHQ
uniref:Uncharacterized protein n=1 Tax=Anguilla anguilla TaxID=7936 RepID=A0A0E9XY41_ANGAN